jgi:hypothetical protein
MKNWIVVIFGKLYFEWDICSSWFSHGQGRVEQFLRLGLGVSESLHRRAQRTSDESYVGSWGIIFIILKVVQIVEELVEGCLALSRVVRYLQPQWECLETPHTLTRTRLRVALSSFRPQTSHNIPTGIKLNVPQFFRQRLHTPYNTKSRSLIHLKTRTRYSAFINLNAPQRLRTWRSMCN